MNNCQVVVLPGNATVRSSNLRQCGSRALLGTFPQHVVLLLLSRGVSAYFNSGGDFDGQGSPDARQWMGLLVGGRGDHCFHSAATGGCSPPCYAAVLQPHQGRPSHRCTMTAIFKNPNGKRFSESKGFSDDKAN